MEDVYSEVYEILDILGKEYSDKLPHKLYEYIKNNRNENNMKKFCIEKPIDEQDFSEETIKCIAYLNLQYWCDEEQKKELLKQYNQNDIKFEKELREKYNPDEIFKNKQKIIENESNVIGEKNIFPTEYKKENVFTKIFNFLRKVFRIKKK